MYPELFTLDNGTLVPSVHCHAIKSLKDVIEAFPKDYIKVYLYVYYMTYPDPEQNPFFNLPEADKEELILQEIGATFSVDNPVITAALKYCDKIYDTPTKRNYRGMKIALDKIAKFFETQAISTGRDGSLPAITQTMSKFYEIYESFKGIEKEYNEEIKTITRGDQFTAYDMR